MKTNEDIGLAIWRAGPFAALWSPAFAAKIGAAARKAVGEPPRMQIQGMSEAELWAAILNSDEYKNIPTIAGAVKVIHRLANTPAEPEADKDALAKKICWEYDIKAWGKRFASPDDLWLTRGENVKDAWRAVAKFLEEKK